MTTFRLLAAAALLSLVATACGGAAATAADEDTSADASASDLKFDRTEPITWTTMAQKASGLAAKDSALMHVDGHLGPTDGFLWSFTFADSQGNWATVQCDGQAAKVIESHHTAANPIGMTQVQLTKVKVTVAKLMTIAGKHGLKGRVGSITLDEALTADLHPHWFIDQGGKDLAVDAYSGAVIQ